MKERLEKLTIFQVILFVCVLLSASNSFGQNYKGGGFSEPGGPVPGWYKKGVALVVGINSYSQGWGRLSMGVSDAKKMAETLRDRDFIVHELYDSQATGSAIISELRKAARQVDVDDRFIFYYSGHGFTQKSAWGKSESGYLVPVDGQGGDPSAYIAMEQLRTEIMNHCRAKHVLFIIDSCFSGSLLTRAPLRDSDVADYLSKRGIYGITAGMHDQPAVDGLFTNVMIEGLEGNADYNGNGFVTFRELGMYTEQNVRALNKHQTPDYGTMLGSGQFVFARKGTVTTFEEQKKEIEAQKAEVQAQKEEIAAQMAQIAAMLKRAERERLEAAKSLSNAQRKREEEDRLAQEKEKQEAARRNAEEMRLAEEAAKIEKMKKKAEAERLAAEEAMKVAATKKAQMELLAAQKAKEEAQRQREAEALKKAEQERLAREEARLDEERKRLEQEKTEKKIAEEKRLAEEAARLEMMRKEAEAKSLAAEQARKKEEEKKAQLALVAAETARKEAERKRKEAALKKAEQERLAKKEAELAEKMKKLEKQKSEEEKKKSEALATNTKEAGKAVEELKQKQAAADHIAAKKKELEEKQKMLEAKEAKLEETKIAALPSETSRRPTTHGKKNRERFVMTPYWSIKDQNTKLEWMVGPDRDVKWGEANRWVSSLGQGGGKWRLPTRKELETLYTKNAGPRNMNPIFNTTGWYVWAAKKGKGFEFATGEARYRPRRGATYKRVFAVRTLVNPENTDGGG